MGPRRAWAHTTPAGGRHRILPESRQGGETRFPQSRWFYLRTKIGSCMRETRLNEQIFLVDDQRAFLTPVLRRRLAKSWARATWEPPRFLRSDPVSISELASGGRGSPLGYGAYLGYGAWIWSLSWRGKKSFLFQRSQSLS